MNEKPDPTETAAQNFGKYLSIAAEDKDGIKLILSFLEKVSIDTKLAAHVVKGWLSGFNLRPAGSHTETWIDFGSVIAESLAIDDGTFYERTHYKPGEIETEAELALRFLAAVPKSYQAAFLGGLGMGGFRSKGKKKDEQQTI